MGFTSLCKNGYNISSPSRGGGYFITHRTPNDTTNLQLPIGMYCYQYYFDKMNRVNHIVSTVSNDTIYSIIYDLDGIWTEIKYNDLRLRRLSYETD